MSDYTSYKADYDRDGFVLVRSFLPPDELKALTAQVNRYVREVVPTLPDQAALLPRQGPARNPETTTAHGQLRRLLRRVPRPTALEGSSPNPHRRSRAGEPARVVQQATAD